MFFLRFKKFDDEFITALKNEQSKRDTIFFIEGMHISLILARILSKKRYF